MKKFFAAILLLTCVLGLAGCVGGRKYRVTVADDYPLANTLQESYRAGEEVAVKLPTVTEHYYTLRVNGDEMVKNENSDLEYTWFVFSMPDCDVVIEIEDHWVEIPRQPEN